MKIRAARADDASQIAQVHVRSWQAAYKGLMPDDFLQNLSVEERVEQWTNGITNSPTLVDLCEDNERLVGFVAYGRCRGDQADLELASEIYSIYLVPEAWGKGCGQALLDAALHRLQNDGYRTTILWVLDSNDRAIQFYERNGFRPDGNTTREELSPGVTVTEVRYTRPFTVSL